MSHPSHPVADFERIQRGMADYEQGRTMSTPQLRERLSRLGAADRRESP